MVISLKQTDLIIKKEKVANLCFEIDIRNIKEQILNMIYSDNCQWRTLRNGSNGHSLFVFDPDEYIFLHSRSNKNTKEEMENELVEQIKKNDFSLGGGFSVNIGDMALKWNSDGKLFAISIDFNKELNNYILKINDTKVINLYDVFRNIAALGFDGENIDLGDIESEFKGVYTSISNRKHKLRMILTTYKPFVEGIRTKTGDWVV